MKANINVIVLAIGLSFFIAISKTCFAETGERVIGRNSAQVIPGRSVTQAQNSQEVKESIIGVKQAIADNLIVHIEPPEINPVILIEKDTTIPSLPWIIPVLGDREKLPNDLGLVQNGGILVGDSKEVDSSKLISIPERAINENAGEKISPPGRNILKPPASPKLEAGYFPLSPKPFYYYTPIVGSVAKAYNKYPFFGASFIMRYYITSKYVGEAGEEGASISIQ